MNLLFCVWLEPSTLDVGAYPYDTHAGDTCETPYIAPACEVEDEMGCYWDGRTMGNGRGESFITLPNGSFDGARILLDMPPLTIIDTIGVSPIGEEL